MTQKGPLVIVGAGPGIGAATAHRFGREGHPVGLVARDAERLNELHGELRATGIDVATAAADATNAKELRAALVLLEKRLGRTEILLFSPLPAIARIKPVLETSAEDLAAAVALNVVAAATAATAVVGGMRRDGRGTLLFTTGGAALEPHRDRAVSGVAYAAESVYVRMLHDALAPEGVHVAQLTIVGAVGPGRRHEAPTVAEHLWERHSRRDRPLTVLR